MALAIDLIVNLRRLRNHALPLASRILAINALPWKVGSLTVCAYEALEQGLVLSLRKIQYVAGFHLFIGSVSK